ncbi:MAG: TonB-dependent receptor [Bryocella sp.]
MKAHVMSGKTTMLRWITMVMAAVLLTTAGAWAQYDNGSMVGTIRDTTGAVVPGAMVTITNNDTGSGITVKTNASGDYNAPSLRTGEYKITAKAEGFAQAVAENITVSVGGRQRIDLTLGVSGTNTTVEVSGVALQLETETSQRDQTITNYQSAAFPLVTRNYADLMALVPGTRQAPTSVVTSSANSLVRAGSYNVNGQPSMNNNFLLDGLDNNAYGESNQGFDNQIIAVPPDSVAQFSIVTNNESAEYGRASGATINVATRGGTNDFHATAYEFIRNTDLNAAGFFKPTQIGGTGITTPFQKPKFNRNQFGVNFGGKILPNKLFYFVDYEGFRQVLKTLNVRTMPTQNELNGILAQPVRNPVTGTTYAAGTNILAIPGAINPLSAQILTYYQSIYNKLPLNGIYTGTGSAVSGLSTNNYASQVPFTDNSDKGDVRLDYQQSSATSWFLRVSDRKENALNSPPIPLPLDGQANGKIRVLNEQVAAGFNHAFGANKFVDVRLGLSRTKAGKYTQSIGDTSFSIPGLPNIAGISGGLPSIAITNFSSFGRQSTNPQWQNPSIVDPKVNYTWVKGHHSMKFGFEYEHIWMAVNDNTPLYGSWTYGGGYSLCNPSAPAPNTCPYTTNISGGAATTSATADNYWADFLFGTTSTYQLANYFVVHLRQTLLSSYAQDDWKVSPKLTLNLGVRWEYGSPYSDWKNNISNFDPVSQTLLTITPGATAGNGITPVSASGVYGSTLVNPDLNDFAPRLGFAYALTNKTAIRGGFGMSYVHYTRAGSGNILAINAPQAQFAAVKQPTPTPGNHCSTPLPAQIIPVGGTAPSCYATSEQGFPSGLVTTFNSATDNITWVPKDTRDSYVESYFLDVQQQVMKNAVFDVAYVGSHGLKLQGFMNGNQMDPSKGFARPYANWPSDITLALNQLWSHYDSLQVKYEQRMRGGLTLLNSFTWQHALDVASASLEGNTPSVQDANNIAGSYAQSDYNTPIVNLTSLVYELPFGHGRHWLSNANGIEQTLLGGWQLSAINTMQGGTPFNLTYNPNTVQQLSPQISATYRGANEYQPYKIPGVPVTLGRNNRSANTGYVNYVNPAAFKYQPIRDNPPVGTTPHVLSPFGNAGRNPGRSPAFYQTDLAVNKKFTTPVQKLKIEFRAEFYNLFNHTNLYLPGNLSGPQGTTLANTTVATGGSVPLSAIVGGTPTAGGQITSTFQPRIIQFGVKLLY